MMQYKGYQAEVDFDDDANVFHGEVVGIRDVITFQGQSVGALKKAFRDSVDDYLAFCRERGEAPEKPYSGRLSAQITPGLHRRVDEVARSAGLSVDEWVKRRLAEALGRSGNHRRGRVQKSDS